MYRNFYRIAGILIVLAYWSQSANAQSGTLVGNYGGLSGDNWAAAWVDLEEVQDFFEGERLCLFIGGSEFVLVRFLPQGAEEEDPRRDLGVDNGQHTVPESGALEITLVDNHPETVQISVHGGKRAWHHMFPEGNGPPSWKAGGARRLSGNDICQ